MNRLCILGERSIAVNFAGLMLLVTITLSARHARADCTLSQTYSTLVDFTAGSATEQLIVGDNDIQVKPPKPMLPFFNVACSERGTMARVDINTGTVVGEYWTAPEGHLKNPSRTTVDHDGNVWIANRDENGLVNGVAMGSITRIGYVVDKVTHQWADASKRYVRNPDGTYTQNNTGEYIKLDDTLECTGWDRYGTTVGDNSPDGYIRTSQGLSNILHWDQAQAGGQRQRRRHSGRGRTHHQLHARGPDRRAHVGRHGWAITELGPKALAAVSRFKPRKQAFEVFRRRHAPEKCPAKMLKWSCGCTTVRCATDLRATCEDCGQHFEREDNAGSGNSGGAESA